MTTFTRRDVFSLGGGVAVLATAGRLPLLGASALPDAAAPVEGYLRTHSAVRGPKIPHALEYAVLRWMQTNPKTGETKNVDIGRLTIETKKEGDGVQLVVRQRTSYPAPVNRLEAEARCKDDGWLTLRSWKVRSWIEERDDCTYDAKGVIEGGRARIDDGISERTLENIPAAIICQWALPMALASGKAKAGGFAMLEDLGLMRAEQTLAWGPEVRVPLQGIEHALASWVHTGRGVLPIHYLVDENGLPQLMTQGVLAWALQKAA